MIRMAPKSLRPVKVLLKLVIGTAAAAFLVVATLLLIEAFSSRTMPELQPWHESAPRGEFRHRDTGEGFALADYLRLEDELFARLDDYKTDPSQLHGISIFLRYVRNGPNDPCGFEPNWNRTFELVPEEIKGGVLLVHGLTDSPYSMRSLANTFHEQGYYVLGLRLPGHGTVPAALLSVSWKDWMAAVEIGARHVADRIGDRPFCLGGYSNGGALAMLYTLRAVEDGCGATPDKVFLFSPAVGVTLFAVASNWHKLYSWIPYFEKSKWFSLQPEFDPYKYNSFPKEGGAQIWELAGAVQKRLARAAEDDLLDDLPAVITFQSIVDSTIRSSYVVEKLYDKLGDNGSELVVFDVNRYAGMDGFYREDNRGALNLLERPATLLYGLTVITNENPDSVAVVAKSRPPHSTEVNVEELRLEWPRQVYSLAHVAIPFPPHDPIYGDGAVTQLANHVTLGNLALRGEKGVLNISAQDLMRLRHNPFHSYMTRRITDFIGGGGDGQSVNSE